MRCHRIDGHDQVENRNRRGRGNQVFRREIGNREVSQLWLDATSLTEREYTDTGYFHDWTKEFQGKASDRVSRAPGYADVELLTPIAQSAPRHRDAFFSY